MPYICFLFLIGLFVGAYKMRGGSRKSDNNSSAQNDTSIYNKFTENIFDTYHCPYCDSDIRVRLNEKDLGCPNCGAPLEEKNKIETPETSRKVVINDYRGAGGAKKSNWTTVIIFIVCALIIFGMWATLR